MMICIRIDNFFCMRIIDKKINKEELKFIAENTFGDMVKAVVDVDKNILCIDAELHSDIESFLLEKGSQQNSLWGINLYPDIEGDDFIEFDSLINIRPNQGNRNRGVNDENIQKKIKEIVFDKIEL
jgi:hypothetical protein